MLRKLPEPEIDETALKSIRCTIGQAIRRGRFHRDEYKDLLHDIIVELLQKMHRFDPHLSSWSTFCSMIARNYLASESRRRYRQAHVDSLQDDFDGYPSETIQDSIEDRHSTSHCFCQRRTDQEWVELQEDLAALFEQMPEALRLLCESYLQSPSLAEVASTLGVSRQTVYRRRQVVREFVAEEHLHEYRYCGGVK